MGERILGVEGGGTKTAWVLLEEDGGGSRLLEQGKLPPANFRLTSAARLRAILSELPRDADRAGVFLAGCAEDDQPALASLCRELWPNAKIVTGSDRDSGLAAALGRGDGIVVNAGTGAAVTGRRGERIEKAGGWGHILGDAGGGYFLSLQALRLILREYDLHRAAAQFTADILAALALNSRDELVRWAQTADKTQIAMLAPIVLRAAVNGEANAVKIVEESAAALTEYTQAVTTRLHLLAPKVVLLGGLFQRDGVYTHTFRRRLKKEAPDARVMMSERSPELGAAWLAMEMDAALAVPPERANRPIELASATTEQRNERSALLDQLSTRELVDLFIAEERLVQEALHSSAEPIARAVELVAKALRGGGRLFYIGAGTSGRLGVLDASEIPPTFGASPDVVQGIIAGGAGALHRSVEGAEDERGAGALAIHERNARAGDVACGISASGRTPFVLGALEAAQQLGLPTILLTCNRAAEKCASAGLQINLPTGPEIVTGSTRLKAGTATKVALNIISTGAMIRLGKVRGNVMSHVLPTNAKLRDRAARIVADLRKCSYDEAVARLEKTNWDVPSALDCK